MKKLKHSKYKNTGIIFEILSRSMVNEVMNKRPSDSFTVIKKFFREGSELNKELRYYRALTEVNPKLENAEKLIDMILESYNSKIDRDKLSREKYRLIGEIKKRYDLDTFFESRVSNYRLLASIYKIFEHSPSDNPTEHLNCRASIAEHITGEARDENVLTEVQTVWETQNPDIRKLAAKIVIDKFNEKYDGLNVKQKTLLRKFVTENTEGESFRDYVYDEVHDVRKRLSRLVGGIDNTTTKIKVQESINLLDTISSSKQVKREHLSAMLKYYQLVEELS